MAGGGGMRYVLFKPSLPTHPLVRTNGGATFSLPDVYISVIEIAVPYAGQVLRVCQVDLSDSV